jgi:serine protease inhibitor
MKALLRIFILSALAWSMAACRGNPQSINALSAAAVTPVAEAENGFGFRLLRTLISDHSLTNVIISPLSVSQGLIMAFNGAAGGTQRAMAQTLGIGSISSDPLNAANRQLLKSLHQPVPYRGYLYWLLTRRRNRKAWLKIANALWVEKRFSINREFVNLNEDFYGAETRSLDFGGQPQRATDTINAWVSRNTQGKIPSILEGLSRDTALVLTDAVYFNGRWKEPFQPHATAPRAFFLLNGKSVMTPMMSKFREAYPYLETDAFQAILMPYANPQFAMYVFLPRKRDGLGEFLKSLDQSHWKEWAAKFSSREGAIVLPKFQLGYGNGLVDSLKALGMKVAFEPGAADFSGITSSRQLYISDVEHKTYVKIDERGTEAAAATAMIFYPTARSFPGPFEMIVDHPFLFAIADQQSGAILFVGTVIDPSQRG